MTHTRTALHILTAACALVLLSTRASAQDPAKDAKPSAKPPASKLIAEADAIGKAVVEIRGLPLKSPVEKGIYTREHMRELLLAMIASEFSDAELAREARVYRRLGLLPDGLDYKATAADLLTEQIAGFYDRNTQHIYIMAGLPETLQRSTMAHEISLSIQDQHFHLQSLHEPFSPKTSSDFHFARRALIEGDAAAVLLDFSLYETGDLPRPGITSAADMSVLYTIVQNMSLDQLTALERMMSGTPETKLESELNAAPAIIRGPLLFPFFAGVRFVFAARASKTWADVDAIYADAPVSTEQIIHPERYFSKDMPVFLNFDPRPPKPFARKPTYTNVLGEFQMYIWVREHLSGEIPGKPASERDAASAVEGWGGDKILAFEDKAGHTLVAHMSAWDSRDEAKEYYDALTEGTERRYAGITEVPVERAKTSISCYYAPTPAPHQLCIELRKDTVLYLDGLPVSDPGAPLDTILGMRDDAFDSLETVDYDTAFKRAEKASKRRRAEEAKKKAKKK